MREGALAATLARLSAADPECTYAVGVPDGDGWEVLGDVLADPARLDRWLATVQSELAEAHADVAAAYLASFVGFVVAGSVAGAVHRERRGWPIDLDATFVHRTAEGWFDGLALARPAVWVLPDDPAAADRDAEVLADVEALHEAVAREVVAALTPLFEAVRRRASYGVRGMWGLLADEVAGGAVWQANRRGADTREAWAEANLFLDAIARRAPLKVRPRFIAVNWSRGVTYVTSRGTCCLFYKTQLDPDPCGEGYCGTCPLREPDSLLEALREYLEHDASEGAEHGSR